MGLEHEGGVNHLALTRAHTLAVLLSAYFYHPFRHKGGNYAHFSAQPHLPEYQAEVYQKLPGAPEGCLGRLRRPRNPNKENLLPRLLHAP